MGSQPPDSLNEYLEKLEAHSHPVLEEMERLAKEKDFPIIGHQCGKRMAILAHAIGAKRVFEVGSGFGYSTLWFAMAVGSDGVVMHTEFDEKNSNLAREFLGKAGLSDRCRFLIGDGLLLLQKERGPFDCILIDCDKKQYPLALQEAVAKLRVGGLLFAHNVIWSGRVASQDNEPSTEAIRKYNKEIMGHPELLSYIDPVHDGLAVSVKIPLGLKQNWHLD
ncbi:MAG TPA: O-methyltransferase [Fimbriimonadales bacterium]|nr:O-methyltransferase [Fimbriimonadales bacterium]